MMEDFMYNLKEKYSAKQLCFMYPEKYICVSNIRKGQDNIIVSASVLKVYDTLEECKSNIDEIRFLKSIYKDDFDIIYGDYEDYRKTRKVNSDFDVVNLNIIRTLDLSNEKLIHLVDDSRDVENIRMKILNGLAMSLSDKVLIGMDVKELLCALENAKETYWSLANSKELLDEEAVAEKLVALSGIDVTQCHKAYLCFKGDFTLITLSDVVGSVQDILGEEADIIFSAIYDENMAEEYEVISLFIQYKISYTG